MPIVNPIHAREGDVVDIHWRLKNGQVYIERRTTPPEATRAAVAGRLADCDCDQHGDPDRALHASDCAIHRPTA